MGTPEWDCLGTTQQRKVDDKSNEITAIPELLRLLNMSGCIVTIDAMGCQKTIAQLIWDEKADYVLRVKDNQGKLHQDLQDWFAYARQGHYANILHTGHVTINKDQGRIERENLTFCVNEMILWVRIAHLHKTLDTLD